MTDSGTDLPEEFLSRLARLLPEEACSLVLNAFDHARPTTFRVNTLKKNPQDLITALEAQGFISSPVPWFTNAFILVQGTQRALSETPEYKNGEMYVQSLSSMLPPRILDPKPGERVLDIAAAPGSKTTQMGTMMQNRGEIVANDTSQARIYRLKANMALQGASIAHVSRDDGRAIWKRYPEYFDKTLVDVPCSMEGRFNSQDPKSYQDWSVKKVKDLSHLQQWLLRSAISATKVGGTIVYSTCTLSPEENEGVIDWILEKEARNIEILPITVPELQLAPGIRHWGGKPYDPEVTKCVRIYPSDRMEGFFVAKLKKIRNTVPSL